MYNKGNQIWCSVVCMQGRGDDLLNVQPLAAIIIIIINALVAGGQQELWTYRLQSLDEQPFLGGNIVLERSL